MILIKIYLPINNVTKIFIFIFLKGAGLKSRIQKIDLNRVKIEKQG